MARPALFVESEKKRRGIVVAGAPVMQISVSWTPQLGRNAGGADRVPHRHRMRRATAILLFTETHTTPGIMTRILRKCSKNGCCVRVGTCLST